MPVKLRVAAFMDGSMKTTEMDLAGAGDSIKEVLKKLDREKKFGRNFFSSMSKHPRATFLLNGTRVDPPEFGRKLADGDEISIIGPVAGG